MEIVINFLVGGLLAMASGESYKRWGASRSRIRIEELGGSLHVEELANLFRFGPWIGPNKFSMSNLNEWKVLYKGVEFPIKNLEQGAVLRIIKRKLWYGRRREIHAFWFKCFLLGGLVHLIVAHLLR